MSRLKRRNSPLNCLLLFGFIWFLILTFFISWNQRDSDDVKPEKVTEIQLKLEDQPVFEDFEDDFADLSKKSKKLSKIVLKKDLKENKIYKAPQTTRSNIEPPELSPEVLELHVLLNLTNPGHLGRPVILPSNLSSDIAEKIKISWEIYSFNEFVSNLVPLYRELPDIRPEYCRTVSYSDDLPVTSVIMVSLTNLARK